MLYHLGQNHLETNFAETNFLNAKMLIWANHSAQLSVFAETDFPNTKTLIWARQNAQISAFAFEKLFSAKLVSLWFCPKNKCTIYRSYILYYIVPFMTLIRYIDSKYWK